MGWQAANQRPSPAPGNGQCKVLREVSKEPTKHPMKARAFGPQKRAPGPAYNGNKGVRPWPPSPLPFHHLYPQNPKGGARSAQSVRKGEEEGRTEIQAGREGWGRWGLYTHKTHGWLLPKAAGTSDMGEKDNLIVTESICESNGLRLRLTQVCADSR